MSESRAPYHDALAATRAERQRLEAVLTAALLPVERWREERAMYRTALALVMQLCATERAYVDIGIVAEGALAHGATVSESQTQRRICTASKHCKRQAVLHIRSLSGLESDSCSAHYRDWQKVGIGGWVSSIAREALAKGEGQCYEVQS